MKLPTVITTIPSRMMAALQGIIKRFRGRNLITPAGMGQIEVPPPVELLHPSEEFNTAETAPDNTLVESDSTPTETFPYEEHTKETPKWKAVADKLLDTAHAMPYIGKLSNRNLAIAGGSAALTLLILVIGIPMMLMNNDEDEQVQQMEPITISLPEAPLTPTQLPTIEPTTSIPTSTIPPPPTRLPTLQPPPTITPTPLPPTPTLPPAPTYVPPTPTPEPTPTPRNLEQVGNPPHVVCIKYTLNDLPQADVSVRIVQQGNQNLMLARAAVTDKNGTACLQAPVRTLEDIAVPVVSGWTWEPVDGEVVLRGNVNVMAALEVKRCTGSQGHLPVIRASGELKCPYKK